MKGIILAGGAGTRLRPATLAISKQLLPVFDKPMIYYPLTTLMLAGITEILIITAPKDQFTFQRVLGDGGQWGLRLQYAIQDEPRGIAESLLIARDFTRREKSALILGDNLFYGYGFSDLLRRAAQFERGAVIFAYHVRDPERYGVIEFDKAGKPKDIIEKPRQPPSNYAVTGLYYYDGAAAEIAAQLAPSKRGELEITDVNRSYLERGQLVVQTLGRGFAWLDTGTPESLMRAAEFIEAVELRQGLKIGVPEEVAWRMGLIDAAQLARLATIMGGNDYSRYIERVLAEGR